MLITISFLKKPKKHIISIKHVKLAKRFLLKITVISIKQTFTYLKTNKIIILNESSYISSIILIQITNIEK
jgi:hypothetical protein